VRRRSALLALLIVGSGFLGSVAHAQEIEQPPPATVPSIDSTDDANLQVPVPTVPPLADPASEEANLSQSVSLIVVMAMASAIPSLMVLMTSFTRFVIVFSLTRNAIGVQNIPPAPVLIGLALFLTLFVMNPVLTTVNEDAIQPLLNGELAAEEAFDAAYQPLRGFMLAQTNDSDLRLFMDMADGPQPETPEEVPASTLVPAFIVSEIRTAFIIGFLIFVPFLIIDLIVAAITMSLGMVMLPPVFISLPLKLLVFVLVDGWVLIVGSVVSSVQGAG
jgi:flagellar biosynthetic protein FliP